MNRRTGYPGAAAHLAVPVGTLKTWVHRKQVPHIRYGARSVVFDLDELDAWIAERTVRPERAR